MFCPNLMKIRAKWRYHALTQGIRTIKTFTEHKSNNADQLTATQEEAVSNIEITVTK